MRITWLAESHLRPCHFDRRKWLAIFVVEKSGLAWRYFKQVEIVCLKRRQFIVL
jgi:hypothetical protein